MLNKLSVKHLCYSVLIATLAFLSCILALSILAQRADKEVSQRAELRYRSYLLADELRQSSDDLTRLARTYVVTGDPRYEQQYADVLDIRNGRKPRPRDYQRIYWDFVAAGDAKPRPDGTAVPLLDLMRESGFSAEELAKLEQARANSDALVKTEVKAMNAVKGLFEDTQGTFTLKGAPDFELARNLMHSTDYHRFKADIMKPVDEFFVLLDQRTARAIDEARDRAGLYQALLIGAIATMLVVNGFLAWQLLRRVVQPLRALSDVLIRMHTDRDLTRRVPESGARDEYGEVASALNGLFSLMQTSMDVVRQGAKDLLGAARQLSRSAEHVQSRSHSQSEAAASTAAAVEQLAVSIAQVADNAAATSRLADAATKRSDEGARVVHQAMVGISSIAENVNVSSSLAQSLARRSEDIQGIVRVIKEVAEQTNLLALNAAIEAARAGEQGRRFAVVADEVRKLAERTASSTAEITSMIQHVSTDTREVASTMEQSTGRVTAGVEMAEKAAQALTEIREGTSQTLAKIIDIADATQEQSGASNEIARHVERIAQMTEENSQAAVESAQLATRLETLATDLQGEVERFKT